MLNCLIFGQWRARLTVFQICYRGHSRPERPETLSGPLQKMLANPAIHQLAFFQVFEMQHRQLHVRSIRTPNPSRVCAQLLAE